MSVLKTACIPMQVDNMTLLNDNVYFVRLRCQSGCLPRYYAGQYLKIVISANESFAFSIASLSYENQKTLELHIQYNEKSKTSFKILTALKTGLVHIFLPEGNCYLDFAHHRQKRPLLLIGAGTGFSQIKAMVEYCFQISYQLPIYVYWGGRSSHDLYMKQKMRSWSNNTVTCHLVVSDEDSQWTGRRGLLYQSIIYDADQGQLNLSQCATYISGSPAMVQTTAAALLEKGLNPDYLHSDVLT